MVNLSVFSDIDNLSRVLKYVVDNSKGLGVNLQVLTKFYLEHLLNVKVNSWDKEYRKAYMRLYRFFRSLAKEDLIEIRKADGLIWVKAKPNKAVDLIFYARKIQTHKTHKRINEYRFTAQEYVEHKHRLNKTDWEFIYDLFLMYLEDTSRRILVFRSLDDDEIFIKPYSHRFQEGYFKKVKRKLKLIFENASMRYKEGVFLTLTMDPKTYDSIYDASRLISISWNRFMSWLYKRVGFRPRYVAVLEWQDFGNPHLHVVLFGVSRIEDHWRLTEYLKGIGFGEIHWEYQIVNNGGSWVWRNPKAKPKGSTSYSVFNYLKKYLSKIFYGLSNDSLEVSISEMKISLYFATNKRFFTYSRELYRPVCYPRWCGWEFIGSYDIFDPPDWLVPYLDEYLGIMGLGPP